MSAEVICLYYKYGHCKFSSTCRHRHEKDICESKDCEIETCKKRHPKSCRFFEQFQRCKFGEFCSFAHRIKDDEKGDYKSVNERLSLLENKLIEKDCEIENLKQKVSKVEKNQEEMLENLKSSMDNVVKEALEGFVKTVMKQQDDVGKKNESMIETLQCQIESLANLLKPSETVQSLPNPSHAYAQPEHRRALSDLSSVHPEYPQALPSHAQTQVPPNQCTVCGKSFGSSRALTNHIRNDHKPKI